MFNWDGGAPTGLRSCWMCRRRVRSGAKEKAWRRRGGIKGKVDERLRRGGEMSPGAGKSEVQEKWIKAEEAADVLVGGGDN